MKIMMRWLIFILGSVLLSNSMWGQSLVSSNLGDSSSQNVVNGYPVSDTTQFLFIIRHVSYSDSAKLKLLSQLPKINLNQRISDIQLTQNEHLIITHFENIGYPFTIVTPNCSVANDSTLFVDLMIDLGPLIRYDSIDIKGSSNISQRFLLSYLGIKKREVYSENRLNNIEKQILKLSYIQMVKSPDVAFIDSTLRVILYLNKKNSSQFDGIIGILPQSEGQNKPLVTGDLKLNLQNKFGQGEQLMFSWKRPVPLSQDLFVFSMFPYVFGTKYGFTASFKMQKKDTTSLTNVFKIGGQLFFNGLNNVSIYYENSTSKLLSISQILLGGTLGNNIDYSVNRYGVSVELDYLNDPFIPTKGVKFVFDANVGTRALIKNVAIPNEYYQEIDDHVTQVRLNSLLDGYCPLFTKLVFNVSGKINYLSGDHHFENELFRIGGLNSLRGFNEESITATFVSAINTEIRWMMDRRTFVYAFWNGAYYEKRLLQKFVHDTPNGFGVGLSFDSPAGIFNITYALGKEFNNPIQLKYGKVHFGIVARF